MGWGEGIYLILFEILHRKFLFSNLNEINMVIFASMAYSANMVIYGHQHCDLPSPGEIVFKSIYHVLINVGLALQALRTSYFSGLNIV